MIHLVGLGTVPTGQTNQLINCPERHMNVSFVPTGHTNQLINCPERHMNVSFNSFMMKVFII